MTRYTASRQSLANEKPLVRAPVPHAEDALTNSSMVAKDPIDTARLLSSITKTSALSLRPLSSD